MLARIRAVVSFLAELVVLEEGGLEESGASSAVAKSTAEPALIPSTPMDLYAQMPRSWIGSPKTTTIRDAEERFLETRIGTRGSVELALKGRCRVVRPRDWRRERTILRVVSGYVLAMGVYTGVAILVDRRRTGRYRS